MTDFRPCKCLDCGHTWRWPVQHSETTQNLSGEKNIYCPACNSRNVMAGPVEAEHKATFAHATIEGGRVVVTEQKVISQSQLTADCFMVQVWGAGYCKKCEFLDTPECGGKRVRAAIKAGKYPLNGLPSVD